MRYAATTAILLAAVHGTPAQAEAPPGLAAWLAEKGVDVEISSLQTGLLIVDRVAYDAKPQPGSSEQAQMGVHLWHYVVGERALTLTTTMNGDPSALATKLPPSLGNLAKIFDDALVWQRGKKACRLWIGREVALDPSECAKGDGKSIAFALRRALGFNAVVVARKGSYLLVEGPAAAIAFGGQGLLFQNSAAKSQLSPEERKGGAMVQLVEGSGRFGVYETFLAKGTAAASVPKGTKILLDDP